MFGSENVEDEEIVGSQNIEDGVKAGSQNVKDEVQVWSESVDSDYVGNEDDLGSISDIEYEHSDEIDNIDWTTVPDKLVGKVNNSDMDDDSGVLRTPPASDDDEEHERFPTYKSGEVFKFQLGMMFSNKEMVRDALKEYAMEMKKNVYLKKNDGKRMVLKCMMVVSST